MSYYPPQGSYVAQPVAYSSSHHGHGYETYQPSQAHAVAPVVIAPSSSRRSHRSHRSRSPSRSRHGHGHSHSRRHRRHHSSTPQVISTGGSTVAYANAAAYPQAYPYGPRLSFTDRLRRFFGFAPRSVDGVKYKHQGKYSSWGFLGRSKRRRYVDARTGAEVDKRGRPVYRV
ncbi:hypothetical protein AB1N83_002028 [Pleurotus pulmonarius]